MKSIKVESKSCILRKEFSQNNGKAVKKGIGVFIHI